MNSDDIPSVLIIGCGWVGRKLAAGLIDSGYKVYGTTRSDEKFHELEKSGIIPLQLQLPVNDFSEIELPFTDSVVISITPGRGGNRDQYPHNIEQVARYLGNRNGQVIMYSSTSAYKSLKKEVIETDAIPDPDSTNALLAAEGVLFEHIESAVVLRLAGLYGNDRHPVKHLAGRKNVTNGDKPVNLVHREDVINTTQKIIEKGIKGEVFNVCSNEHPSREKTYGTLAAKLGLEVPTFKKGGEDSKRVNNTKVKKMLGIEFLHPDPLSWDISGLKDNLS